MAKTGDLGGDFGFETEPTLFDHHVFKHFPSEGFVTGLHIGESLSIEPVAEVVKVQFPRRWTNELFW